MSEEKKALPCIYCQVLTPFETVFEGEVEVVTCPAIDGDVGIYYSHTPFTTLLCPGQIRLDLPGECDSIYLDIAEGSSSLLEVCVDRVRIFLD